MIVAGIDPGTKSMDIVVLDDQSGKILLKKPVPRDKITRDPTIPIKILEDFQKNYDIAAITAPSGYGIPLKPVQKATLEEILEATFIHKEDCMKNLKIVGLRKLMILLKESNLPAWFTPGVIHLPTVPEYRKINRIDLGTADKIYSVARAMVYERETYNTMVNDMNFVLVEAGQAYNAALLVETGEITDGIGGTMAWWGLLGGGFIDAETCYALSYVIPAFSKSFLFEGGIYTVYGYASYESIENELMNGKNRAIQAAQMIKESILKTIASILSTTDTNPRVYLSGRLFRNPILADIIVETIKKKFANSLKGITLLETRTLDIKAAALGSAYIASGIAGGKYSWIIDALKLDKSKGSIFDYIKPLEYAEKLKESFTSKEIDCTMKELRLA